MASISIIVVINTILNNASTHKYNVFEIIDWSMLERNGTSSGSIGMLAYQDVESQW